jgi:hypothetical protein
MSLITGINNLRMPAVDAEGKKRAQTKTPLW